LIEFITWPWVLADTLALGSGNSGGIIT